MNTIAVNSKTSSYCPRHPQVETHLSCVQCSRHICIRCAAHTGGGYKCPTCIKALKARFTISNGRFWDYLIAPAVVFPLALVTTLLFYLIGNYVFSTFVALVAAPWVAGQIARAVRWSVRHRRSRYLAQVAAASFVLAVIPFVLADVAAGALFSLATSGSILVFGTRTLLAQLS